MRLQHIFKALSQELATAPNSSPEEASTKSVESHGYGDLDKVINKIGKSLEKNKGQQKGIAVLDFGEPAIQMDLEVFYIVCLKRMFTNEVLQIRLVK